MPIDPNNDLAGAMFDPAIQTGGSDPFQVVNDHYRDVRFGGKFPNDFPCIVGGHSIRDNDLHQMLRVCLQENSA